MTEADASGESIKLTRAAIEDMERRTSEVLTGMEEAAYNGNVEAAKWLYDNGYLLRGPILVVPSLDEIDDSVEDG